MIIFAIAFVAASALSFVLYVLLREVTSATNATFLLIFLSSVLLYALLLGGTFYSVKVRHKSSVTSLGLKMDGMWRGIAWGLGLGLPLFVGAIFLAYVSERVLRDTNAPDMVSKSVNRISSGSVSGVLILLLFLTLVVLAPVCEEIFFRGYLYPALRNRMDRQPAMLLNGLLFAAAHFEIIGFLPRFLLGYGLCYIYERQHNLSGPMMGHALYNGLILLLSGIFQLF
jgi:CAAX protease family protein